LISINMSLNKYLKKKYQKHYTGLILPRARKKNVYNIYRIRFEEDERATSLSSLTHENWLRKGTMKRTSESNIIRVKYFYKLKSILETNIIPNWFKFMPPFILPSKLHRNLKPGILSTCASLCCHPIHMS
jgi:hypothetical protein